MIFLAVSSKARAVALMVACTFFRSSRSVPVRFSGLNVVFESEILDWVHAMIAVEARSNSITCLIFASRFILFDCSVYGASVV